MKLETLHADEQLLMRLEALVAATSQPEAVTPEPAFRAAVARGHALAQQVATVLEGALDAVYHATPAKDALSSRAYRAQQQAVVEFEALRVELSFRLVPRRRGDTLELGGREVRSRLRFLKEMFGRAARELANLSPHRALAFLQEWMDAVEGSPWVTPDDLTELAVSLMVLHHHVEDAEYPQVDDSMWTALQAARCRAREVCDGLENLLLAHQRLAGSSLTLAEIVVEHVAAQQPELVPQTRAAYEPLPPDFYATDYDDQPSPPSPGADAHRPADAASSAPDIEVLCIPRPDLRIAANTASKMSCKPAPAAKGVEHCRSGLHSVARAR